MLSFGEIRSTLDSNGCLDNMPFMPEMIKLCGQKFKVASQNNFICVNLRGMRGINNSVILENVYCDGSLHDGCQKSCTIMWKKSWLKKVSNVTIPSKKEVPAEESTDASLKVFRDDNKNYFCQSSEIVAASFPLNPIKRIQYLLKEFLSGNKRLLNFISHFKYFILFKTSKNNPESKCHFIKGELTETPQESLNLQPGDLVEIKSEEEISGTLDKNGKNRGLLFTAEMHEFCGKKFRVHKRLDKMIGEGSGRLVKLKHTVLLEDVVCHGICKFGCSRHLHHWWREVWLKKL